MRTAKSSSGRIEWILEQGRLKETGPESPAFRMSSVDTLILATLLVAGYDEIKAAAERELSGYSQTESAVLSRNHYYGQKQEKRLQEGAEGIEIDDFECTLELPEESDVT